MRGRCCAAEGTEDVANAAVSKANNASRRIEYSPLAAMNGAQLDGRTLTVNEAKPREDRGGGGGRGGYGGGGGRGVYGGGGGGRRY